MARIRPASTIRRRSRMEVLEVGVRIGTHLQFHRERPCRYGSVGAEEKMGERGEMRKLHVEA
jgi:hypothetical protein